jgi:hypothetical protein
MAARSQPAHISRVADASRSDQRGCPLLPITGSASALNGFERSVAQQSLL